MGTERKRGKLVDLNDVITGRAAVADRFATAAGPISVLSRVRYVITLDDDTDLPPGAARSLVSVIAHPLNQAHYDPGLRRVVRGYGILQPRIEQVGYGPGTSRLSRALSGGAAIDQYTGDVSDIYQDLFGEGSFMGKGIHDVAAVGRALDGVFPANRVLSHDLLEGCYARSGLVGDVILTERPPRQYHEEISVEAVGCAATGRPRRGSCRVCRSHRAARCRTHCRHCPGGSCWTTCAGVW